MKKNYLAKKLTAAMLAGTMVLSMGGMTAFAATEDFPLSIKKIVATDGKSYSPNTQFTFILEKGTVTSYTETKDGVKHTYPVTPGEIEGDDAICAEQRPLVRLPAATWRSPTATLVKVFR